MRYFQTLESQELPDFTIEWEINDDAYFFGSGREVECVGAAFGNLLLGSNEVKAVLGKDFDFWKKKAFEHDGCYNV